MTINHEVKDTESLNTVWIFLNVWVFFSADWKEYETQVSTLDINDIFQIRDSIWVEWLLLLKDIWPPGWFASCDNCIAFAVW